MATYTLFPSIRPGRDSDTVDDAEETPAEAFARGACPWCERDGFDRPKSHARNAHARQFDEWESRED